MKILILRILLLITGLFYLPFLTAGIVISLGEVNFLMLLLTAGPLMIYGWFLVDTYKKLKQHIRIIK